LFSIGYNVQFTNQNQRLLILFSVTATQRPSLGENGQYMPWSD